MARKNKDAHKPEEMPNQDGRSRRSFLKTTSAMAFAAAAPALIKQASAQSSRKVALYTNIGAELLHFDMDLTSGALAKRGSITLPAGVQYAWPHASRRFLYVACSDYFTNPKAARHYAAALQIDPDTGELSQHGEPVQLPTRPTHITTDGHSEFVLVSFMNPSGVQVFSVNKDFTIGSAIPEPGVRDGGFYGHQVRVTPDNRHTILVTRGNNATATKPEDPGALKMFDFDRGILTNETSIAPDGGIGFGPRNLEFHSTKPWAYLSLERESKLYMYRLEGGKLSTDTAYRKETVSATTILNPQQMAGNLRVHPNGRFVYVTNRGERTVSFNGQKVSDGGENNVAVYSIDQKSGEPNLIQHADTQKVYPRNLDIDPSGRFLVAQSTVPAKVREGDDVRAVPAGLTVFRIGNDGKLTLDRVYDLDVTKETGFWLGMIGLK